MKHKIEVGQAVWTEHERTYDLQPHVISKVGRQYFYIGEGMRPTKVDINTLMEINDYGTSRRVYLSKEQHEEERRMGKIRSAVSSQFSTWSTKIPLTDDQYERIYNIIMEGQQ